MQIASNAPRHKLRQRFDAPSEKALLMSQPSAETWRLQSAREARKRLIQRAELQSLTPSWWKLWTFISCPGLVAGLLSAGQLNAHSIEISRTVREPKRAFMSGLPIHERRRDKAPRARHVARDANLPKSGERCVAAQKPVSARWPMGTDTTRISQLPTTTSLDRHVYGRGVRKPYPGLLLWKVETGLLSFHTRR
jgi:hypothetical protein